MVGIFEGMHGHIIPHKITDLTFDEKLGKKEIVTIDNIKYEKALYRGQLDVKQMLSDDSGSYNQAPILLDCGKLICVE